MASGEPGSAPFEVCIIGGGIVGASTAYYLTHPTSDPQRANPPRLPTKLTLIDSRGIAQCASGLSGGFMAENWHKPPTASLARHSFRLHQQLAEQHGGSHNWGYRKLSAISLKLVHRPSRSENPDDKTQAQTDPAWLDPALDVAQQSVIGNETSCAQVHPRLLTEYLIRMCESAEVPTTTSFQVLQATAKSIEWDTPQVVKSDLDSHSARRRGKLLALDHENKKVEIAFDELVLAAGPWSGTLSEQLFPPELTRRLKSVNGMRAHSIVVRSRDLVSPHALFTQLLIGQPNPQLPRWTEPEFYPRPDKTIYICGAGDDEPLPARPADVKVDPEAILSLEAQAKAVIDSRYLTDSNLEVLARQACYLPVGEPLVGRLCPGVLVGTGLGCWGITLGPGTGHSLASMILNSSSTVQDPDLSQLFPI